MPQRQANLLIPLNLVSDQALREATGRIFVSMPGSRPTSLIETKRLMKHGQTEQVLAVMAEEGASFGRMLGEPAAREAFGAFMERRKPDFSKI